MSTPERPEVPAAKKATPAAPSRRRWLLITAIVAGTVLALLVVSWLGWAGYRAYKRAGLPPDAPRIALSLDNFLLNRTGVPKAMFETALLKAEARLVELDFKDGGDPVDSKKVAELLADVDGIILGGGGDVDPRLYGGDPQKASLVNRACDDFQLELIKQARARGIPILGVCRGCQLLNVAFGGTLKDLRDSPEEKDRHFLTQHDVFLAEDSRLARIMGKVAWEDFLSTHQQSIDKLGKGVQAVAWADADRQEIEAVEITVEPWMIGVIWHPEREALRDHSLSLFQALVKQARARRGKN